MVLAWRKTLAKVRSAPPAGGLSRDDYAVRYLLRLLCLFSQPEDVLLAYLRRPLPGFCFRFGIEQLARGGVTMRRGHEEASARAIMTRARVMLRWLDGEDLGGKNPYEVLGLSCLATARQIRSRYRMLSKRVHPDRHDPARQEYWSARQNEINEAYRILSAPPLRAKWQADLKERKQLLHRLWEVERAVR